MVERGVESKTRTRNIRSVQAVLVVAITMLSAFGVVTYLDYMRIVQQEGEIYSRTVRGTVDSAFVRLKDLSSFVAAEAYGAVEGKLQQASRKSEFITGLGYIDMENMWTVPYIGDDVFENASPEDLKRLASRLLVTEGLTRSIRGAWGDDMITDLPEGSVVLVQAMQSRVTDNPFIVYLVLDLNSVLTSSSADLSFIGLESARLQQAELDGEPADESLISFGNLSQTFVPFLFPNIHAPEIIISRDLKVLPLLGHKWWRFAMFIGLLTGLVVMATGVLVAFTRMMNNQVEYQKSLVTAVQKAETANEVKSTFLANMSHEIRTPLNGILGMAQLLSKSAEDEGQRRYIEQIKSSSGVLLAILNDILDLAKLESAQLSVDPVPSKLRNLVHEIVNFYSPSALEKSLRLQLFVDPEIPEIVEVDPTRLRQVIGNLISNAIKFTHQGSIIVSVTRGENLSDPGLQQITFAVEDTGIGISEANIQKLFNRFTQAEDSTTRNYGGTGLGLSICKEISELMGGKVSVRSEEGKGSVFSLTLNLPGRGKVVVPKNTGLFFALVSADNLLTQITQIYLASQGIDCEAFTPHDNVHSVIKERHAQRPFNGLVIDEGDDLHRARGIANALYDMKLSNRFVFVILGNQMLNKGYLSIFHQAIVKPFLAEELADTLTRLTDPATELQMLGAQFEKAKHTKPDVESAQSTMRNDAPYAGRSCLLVDDNQVNLLFATEVLSDLGFSVTRQANGAKAVDAARSDSFDIIFMDCQMPVMDGYEATRQICKLISAGEVPPTPIIALTANALKGDREKCLEAGMDSFLPKPLQMADLNMVLEQYLPPTPVNTSVGAPRFSNAPSAQGDSTATQFHEWRAASTQEPVLQPEVQPAAQAEPRTPLQSPRPQPIVAPVAQSQQVQRPQEPKRQDTAQPLPASPRQPQFVPQQAQMTSQQRVPQPETQPRPRPQPQPQLQARPQSQPQQQRVQMPPQQAPVPSRPSTPTPQPAEPQASATPVAATQPVQPRKEEPANTASGQEGHVIIDEASFAATRSAMKKFDTLLSFYLNDSVEYLANIKQALASGDVENAVMPAHTIKSSSRVVAAVKLGDLAEKFEKLAREEGSAAANELGALRVEMEKVFEATKSKIAEMTSNPGASNVA